MSRPQESPRKKARLDETAEEENVYILNFCPDQAKNIKLQLLESHTVYDLVATLCENVTIGAHDGEGADCHMWFIRYNGKEYESGDFECQSELRAYKTPLKDLNLNQSSPMIHLEYDYGASLSYRIHFLGREELVIGDGQTLAEALSFYPRRKPVPLPTGYAKYEPSDASINLDALFPHFQKWIFESHSATLHFFQPGRKKNWGFFEGSEGKMMYLPVKPDNLTQYLTHFNQGAKCVPKGMEDGGDGYPHYSWHSVVVIPASKWTSALGSKYSGQERGFCDCVRAGDATRDAADLANIFPKLSALAGWTKNAKIPKGWMTVVKKGNKCSITLCKGNTHNHKNPAPKGTSYDGHKQHDPVENPFLDLGEIEIEGLQDLFCVVEGLLGTL